MAKQQKRKRPRGKTQASTPITSHPLFPAVVALWFGALFGLGSLAVRPTLLETLVMKSRLDLIVPAAAPPLGITSRMLIALVLAALGATVGVIVARRIARPKVEQRQRKRGARSSESDSTGHAAPLSIHDELNNEPTSGDPLSGRRRATLAFEHDEVEFVPHEMAPLPGGAPQVLDIAGIELAGYAPVEAEHDEPLHEEPAPLDLGAFAEPAPVAEFDPLPAPAAPAAFAPPIGTNAPGRQIFQPLTAPEPLSQPAPADESGSASRQIFGMPIEDGHVDQSFVRAAGYKTTVFEQEAAEPLFTDRVAVPEGTELPTQMAAASVQQAFAPPPPEPASPILAAPDPVLVEPEPVQAEPVATESLPPVAGLGMTDLASRLQQSMQRRRAARAGAPEVAVAAPEAPAVPAVPDAFAPPVEPAPVAAVPVPQAFEPASAAPAPFDPFAALLASAPAHAVPGPVADVPPAPIAMPAALRPLDLSVEQVHDDDDMLASLLPPRTIAVPVAPIATPVAAAELSQEPAGEAATPPSFAAPAPLPEPAPAASAPLAFTPPAPFSAPAQPAPVETRIETEVEEENYASLLDIGQPLSARSQFVRIEEPEAEGAPLEPVVIFPGQAPLGGAPVLAAVPGGPDPVPFRRFDAPAAAAHGMPVAQQSTQPAGDPGEADQALRAALANLQRMSGAA